MGFLIMNALPAPSTGNFDENHLIIPNENGLDSFVNTANELGAKGIEKVFTWGINAITIIFLCAVIMMILAILFRNGQWQKFAQTTMLWTFLSMLLLRAIPIVILSFRSEMDVDEAFSTALIAISQITLFIALTALMLSLLFRFAYKLIKHPEYHRWSKNTLNVSVMMAIFAIVGPYIFAIM